MATAAQADECRVYLEVTHPSCFVLLIWEAQVASCGACAAAEGEARGGCRPAPAWRMKAPGSTRPIAWFRASGTGALPPLRVRELGKGGSPRGTRLRGPAPL